EVEAPQAASAPLRPPGGALAAVARARIPASAIHSAGRSAMVAPDRTIRTTLESDRAGTVAILSSGDNPTVLKSAAVEPPGPGKPAAVTYLSTDTTGRIFVRIELLGSTSPVRVTRYVRIYDSELNELHTFSYPLDDDGIVADKDIDVDEDG